MPALAENFEVIAVDQRGMGLSDKPRNGDDSATVANDLVALMDALGHQRFAMVGCDTGLLIGYALAADHPDRVDRLALGEAPLPGVSPTPPAPPRAAQRTPVAHPVQRTSRGQREARQRGSFLFGQHFSNAAGKKKLSADAVKYYVDLLAADPEALRGSFELYRAFPVSQAQNEQRKTRRLTMPVLAIGGAESFGEQVGKTMELVADDVQPCSCPTAHMARRAGARRNCSWHSPSSWPRTARERARIRPGHGLAE